MRDNKRNSPLLIGAISALLLVLAVKTRYPVFVIMAMIGIGITYVRFRLNYIAYRQRIAKNKRQSDAIVVESAELKDSDDYV